LFDYVNRQKNYKADRRSAAKLSLNQSRGAPDEPGPIALASRNPETQTVTLVLDTTASIALYAIAAHAGEREAHIREVQRYAATLPDDSYGKENRQHITARETRIATRLRAIEHAYRTAIERSGQPAPETTAAHPHSTKKSNWSNPGAQRRENPL
jgi:hypothetical protein